VSNVRIGAANRNSESEAMMPNLILTGKFPKTSGPTDSAEKAVRISWSLWFRPRSVRKLVDVDRIPFLLRRVSDTELEEFGEFGFAMIEEVLGRINQLESKALIIFGFSAGLIAFLVSELHLWSHSGLGIKVYVAAMAVLAFAAGAFAARALRAIGGWVWPSERDWFPEEAFGNLNAIRRRHLDSLLFTHQKQGAMADVKAAAVVWAQRLLIGSFALLSLLLVWFIFAPPGLDKFVRVSL
jgi:hypothetical protein